jgi:hypothetical protein
MTDKEWKEIGHMAEDGFGIFWRRTNQDTCQHRVIQNFRTEGGHTVIVCGSCDASIDEAFINEREGCYEYDVGMNVWVYIGPKSLRRSDKADAIAAMILAYPALKENNAIIRTPGESSSETQ